jgi:uncharacterized membrane protein
MKGLAVPPEPGAPSRVSVARHPLHPMLVHFPIALLMVALVTDLAFWYTGDPFWARMSHWLIGFGTLGGFAAAATGTVELLWVRDIRLLTAAWSHFVAAMVLLSIASANWVMRLGAQQEFIVPWGIYASALTFVALSMAGVVGGKLVYEHQVGVQVDRS